MKLYSVASDIRKWAHERDLHKADPYKQLAKLNEETGELSSALNKQLSSFEIAEELGDIFVVITILAQQLDLDIETCIDIAYAKIRNRKGKTINGVYVKEEDLCK